MFHAKLVPARKLEPAAKGDRATLSELNLASSSLALRYISAKAMCCGFVLGIGSTCWAASGTNNRQAGGQAGVGDGCQRLHALR